MKKLKKISLLLLVCSMLTGALSVSAAGEPFAFEFSSKDQKKVSDSYPKEDNEQNAYVTIMNTDDDNFLPGDVFGCRVRKASNDSAVTDYTLLTQYGRYILPYTATGYAGTLYYLRGQIDSTGQYNVLTVEGEWLP